MSFSSDVKEELALREYEYEKDMLSGLFKVSGNVTISSGKMALTFRSENSRVAQRVYRSINKIYKVKPVTSIYKSMKLSKSNVYCLSINEKVSELLEDLDLLDFNNYKNIVRSDKRINCYLAGCFMGSGSVNDPKKTDYHLEVSFADENIAKSVSKLIEKMELNPRLIKRRNSYVVYIKRAQEIADFIAKIGATNSYLNFEDYRMTRDYVNSDNRITNCDIANSVRTNIAANEQLSWIKTIDEKVGLQILSNELKSLAKLRLDNPEDSLRELAEKYNELTKKNYSKSGINHLFIKIKNIAMQYETK